MKYLVILSIVLGSVSANADQVCQWIAGQYVCQTTQPLIRDYSVPTPRPQTCTWIYVAGQWQQVCQ